MRTLIVGLSTRAIAESAVRNGPEVEVVTLDYFGDRDQRALVENYALQRDFDLPFSAQGLLEASRGLAFDAVIYTSSLENDPDVVRELARGRTLLGNAPHVLQEVRDWTVLRRVCNEEEIDYAATLLPGEEGQADPAQSWLRKPVRSGGGHGVERWRGEALDEHHVLQREIDGRAASAAFVADGSRSAVLGLSEQLIGREELGAQGYTWCGNVLPLALGSVEARDALFGAVERAVGRLTRRFGLRGLNGIDFVVTEDADGQPVPYLVEVNPRYTASMELVDRACGLSTFDLHVASFSGKIPASSRGEVQDVTGFHGKGILYAEEDAVMPETASWYAESRRDIPFPGERIEAGHPVCTLLVKGETREECWSRLVAKADGVRRDIGIGRD